MNVPPFECRPVFARGLRRNVEDPATEGLALCYGRKPTKRGLVKPPTITNPITGSASTTLAFPYPMLIKGTNKNLYFQRPSSTHGLFELTAGSWSSGSDKMTSGALNNVTGSSTATVANASQWNFAENNDIFLISSGAGYINNFPIHGGEYRAGTTATSAVPKAFCFDDGRLLLGNLSFPSGYFTTDAGKRLWDVFSRHAPATAMMKSGNVPNGQFVMWGPPAGGDPDKPYTLEQVFLSHIELDEYEQILLDAFREWELGFTFVPWDGQILAMHKLGEVIMVYGSENIGYLQPLERGGYTPRFFANLGIASMRAACGTVDEHVFLDKSGILYRINSKLQFEKLWYNEFLSGFASANPVISYDGNTGDFYISKSDDGFLLTTEERMSDGRIAGGLCKSRYVPTSLLPYNGALYGPALDDGAGFLVKTGVINQDSRKVKTVETVELGKADPTNVDCTLGFKAKTGAFTEKGPYEFSDAGIVDFIDSGIDFEVTFEQDSADDDSEQLSFANINFRDTKDKKGLGGYLA